MAILVDPQDGVIKSVDEIDAVGHRVLHGGDKFVESCIIDEACKQAIRDCIPLGPLHNPANLTGIEAMEKLFPGVPNVAVFDTGFHATMPDYAYTYALPKDVCDKYHVRKYGAHGTRHRYEWMMAKEILGSRCHRLLSCHLGNGASLAAIEDGVPVLAICGGYQMLGQYYKTWDGKQCDFTGALDLYTVGSEQRMIGNYMFTCEEADCKIVGFENHSGKTYLGSGVKPLGKVLEGYGNNGEDGTEGARYKNVFASYSHGCLLPKNPKLADLILKLALERKYGKVELPPLADEFETAAHNYMEARLSRK